MSKLRATLTRQLGPFPLGVWLLIVGVGVTVGVAVNRRIGTVSEDPVQLDPEANRRDPYSSLAYPQPGYRGPVLLNPGPLDQTPAVDPITDNDDWIGAGVRAVATGAPGAPSALAVFEALSAYVNGEEITAEQRGMVNAAMVALGPPPFGVFARPGEVPAAPVPVPANPATGQAGVPDYANVQPIAPIPDGYLPGGHTSTAIPDPDNPYGRPTYVIDTAWGPVTIPGNVWNF